MSEFIVLSKDGTEVMRPGGTMGDSNQDPIIFYSADVAYAAAEALKRDDLVIQQRHPEILDDDATDAPDAPQCTSTGCRISSGYHLPD